MNKPAQLNGVTKRFAKATALDNVSLSIRAGELLALLGPNGAGKTTAVRLLLGLTRLDSGEVTVFGLDPRKPRNRVRVGAMLQVARVPETLRVIAGLPEMEPLAGVGQSRSCTPHFGQNFGFHPRPRYRLQAGHRQFTNEKIRAVASSPAGRNSECCSRSRSAAIPIC